eukprot:scaffold28931_cov107-Isochrysis_galbana.AAC.2
MHTDRQQQQAASRQGHTPFSTTPSQRAKNGGMAANLFVRELAPPPQRSATCSCPQRLLSSRGDNAAETFTPNFVFAVRAERDFVFYLARCQGETPSQPKHY